MRQRAAGDEESLIVGEALQLPVEAVAVGVDPECQRGPFLGGEQRFVGDKGRLADRRLNEWSPTSH